MADDQPTAPDAAEDRETRFEAELEEFLEPHGRSARLPEAGWRARLRRTRGGAVALKVVVFLVGAGFIAVGVAAIVLPGPLTIPPMLLGLWILASEFAWADGLFQRAKRSGLEAWEQVKRRPVVSVGSTLLGIAAVVALVVVGGRLGWWDAVRDALPLV